MFHIITSQYREQNIVRDFYLPILSNTKIYKRLIGYFSTEALVLASKGIIELIDNGGTYQLLVSANLEEEDFTLIQSEELLKSEIIEQALIRTVTSPIDSFQQARLNALANLLEKNHLVIKVLIPRNLSFKGLHYEKVGIMEDLEGERLAFTSQINEAQGEYISNYEAIDVFPSWNGQDAIRLKHKADRFEQLWSGEDEFYEVMDLPQSIINVLLSFRVDDEKLVEPEVQNTYKETQISDLFPQIPSFIQIREYQQEAIRNWFRNNCQGLLEMATGTGKTITALSATAKLWEVTNRLGIVIVCPYTHLVDQWVEDIKLFNMSPIVAYQSRRLWEDVLYNEVSAFQAGITNHFCVIMTIATFTSKAMQNILGKLSSDVLFIADEAHHLGARKNRECLIPSFPYRLALSATPNRWFDEEGTDELIKYFGNSIVFQFGLDKAIGKYLTEYYYYPHIVYLDEDESEYYYEITKKIAKMYFHSESLEENESLTISLD